MASLYIHIPFCQQACHYCDFHFSTQLGQKAAVVACICKEIEARATYLDTEVLESIYFGGGTPSLLNQAELQQIFATIRQHFTIAGKAEITLEANPNDLTETNLAYLREAGVNRLSIGIQSFHTPHLQYLHRNHTTEQTYLCLEKSRQAGFEKFSIDLIYGIPATKHEIWEADMRFAVATGVNHISAYALTIEQNTVFGNWTRKGKMTLPDEEFQAVQMEMLMDYLPAMGFEQYEISNFAKDGAYSQHNTHYWKKGTYLGVGPSAHSYNGVSRQWNVSNNAQYLKSEATQHEVEILSARDHTNEYILTSIRTKWGCDVRVFKDSAIHQTNLAALLQEGFITIQAHTIYLTRKGKMVADSVTEKLLFT